VAKPPPYPFAPKSNRWLAPGQFWSVPLPDGRYACGRVMAASADFAERTAFVAGLMDWSGEAPPHAAEIAGCGVIEQGGAHIRVIHETGGLILGCRALEEDGLVAAEDPPTWGPDVLRILAEQHFS
jgi:hypothetical protein